MKHVKMLWLMAVSVAAFMATAGGASATILTDSSGNQLLINTEIHGVAESDVALHPPIGTITCTESTVGGIVSDEGSPLQTVLGLIQYLTFSGCNATVHVLKQGSLEIHTEFVATGNPSTSHQTANTTGNGTLTSKGTRVTVVLFGFHCIFETNPTTGTDIGTVTGSKNIVKEVHLGVEETFGGTATLDVKATIPRVGGTSGAFCGATAAWTGSYKVDAPDYLDID